LTLGDGIHTFLVMPFSERALIFDVDGTLVDSNEAHAAAWAEALGEVGIERDVDAIIPLIGMGAEKLLPRMSGHTIESELGARIARRRDELFRSVYFANVAPFPGARELFQRLREDGVRLAVASAAKREELEALLDVAGVRSLVDRDGMTSAEDVSAAKPSPDAVQVALARLDTDPGAALMVGDSPYDIEAAHQAGIGTIAFRCGGWEDRDLEDALFIYDGPEAMLIDYDDRRWDWPSAPTRPGGPRRPLPANSSLR
jgi:HAD superfamily hydrolase (TIGR01509 family)